MLILIFQSLTPDDKTFLEISKLYASKHTNMHLGKGLCEDDDFPNGVTNGAKWYIVEGGMQVNIIGYTQGVTVATLYSRISTTFTPIVLK